MKREPPASAAPTEGESTDRPMPPARRNPLSPKKLLLTKWTAVQPVNREKHWVVVRVIEPDPPAVRIEQIELEAVHSKRLLLLHWRDLTDGALWRQGWV